MAIDALGLAKIPKPDSANRKQYLLAKGVYTRLLEELYQRERQAQERAREWISNREAQVAALHATDDKGRVGRLEYLKTIQSMREQEEKKRQKLAELSLCETIPRVEAIEAQSDEDLIAVLRIRGNIKGIRFLEKRETILDLLRKSFHTALF